LADDAFDDAPPMIIESECTTWDEEEVVVDPAPALLLDARWVMGG
jgi:hypothetical protein